MPSDPLLRSEPSDPVLELYRDLHRHPELSGQESRTAARLAAELARRRVDVREGIGGTGVVGMLRNGEGPTVLLRADIDGLPIRELTGVPYASTVSGVDRAGVTVPVMHACGHDLHAAALIGAVDVLQARSAEWAGTVAIVFQPAEETGEGALAMIADGLSDIVGTPAVCLGQHVSPVPAGVVVTAAGTYGAASDNFRIRFHGVGGHASTPEAAVDPIVAAAATVMRLQTVISRETGAHEPAVLTVSSVHAGQAENAIPDEAVLTVNLRSFNPSTRQRLIASLHRVVDAEAAAAGMTKRPDVERISGAPLLVNDPEATRSTLGAIGEAGLDAHIVAQPMTGSEDFGVLGEALGCPSVFWHWGGTDPGRYSSNDLVTLMTEARFPAHIPMNHSPEYLPDLEWALPAGIRSMTAAALHWLNTDHALPTEGP
ncbi:amidohydrolase [Microbacterium sp. LWO13-1.2]|uniref:amidohydrolase n=1 Tax=Microbacterium sp. LWO13-1.2 TaxID=3135262 RepID=UPI00313A40B5